jgi:hypothetical protein
MENEAVAAARQRGDFAPLAELLRSWHPLNNITPAIRSSLAPDTYDLLADILTGQHKPPRPRGRRKESELERRERNPIHDAAGEVVPIKRMLLAWYPRPQYTRHHNQALLVVERRYGLKTGALANYLNRSKKDQRRLSFD